MVNLKMNHWWLLQRISAFLTICLLPSMLFSIIEWTRLDFKVLPYWFTFGRAVIFGAFISSSFFHSFLGIETIIEDYIPKEWREKALFLSKWVHVFLVTLTWIALISLTIMGRTK